MDDKLIATMIAAVVLFTMARIGCYEAPRPRRPGITAPVLGGKMAMLSQEHT
jgi:hypothetical protein